MVVGEHKELNEAIIVNLIERGARVSVVRGRGGEGEFGRGWGGRVEREVVGDLETLEGQKEVVDEIERPERFFFFFLLLFLVFSFFFFFSFFILFFFSIIGWTPSSLLNFPSTNLPVDKTMEKVTEQYFFFFLS